MCVNFLKYSIDVFSANFIFIDVSRNPCNLIVAKMFLMFTIIPEKLFGDLTFQSVVLHVYIFYFILHFFDLRR